LAAEIITLKLLDKIEEWPSTIGMAIGSFTLGSIITVLIKNNWKRQVIMN
jgi:hypothetical protein